MDLACACSGSHVRVTIGEKNPQNGVHLLAWDSGDTPMRFRGGPCPREATEEDGACDPCRVFLAERRENEALRAVSS